MSKEKCPHGKEIGKTCVECGGLCLAGCSCKIEGLKPECPVHFPLEDTNI
jgi:hypothetical protein